MDHGLIAKNTFFQLAARIITSITSLAITLLIAWRLGVGGYGVFTQVTVYIGFFYTFVDFGFNAIFLQKQSAKSYFKELLFVRFLFASILIVVSNIIVLFLPYSQEIRFGIMIFSLSLFLQAIIYSSTAIFQKNLQYDLYAKAVAYGSLVTIILIIIFINTSFSIVSILIAILGGGLFTAALSYIWAKESLSFKDVNYQVVKELILESMPLGMMLIFNLLYFKVDIFLLSLFKSTTDVGIYGLAYRFFDFLIALPFFLSNSLYPFLLEHEKKYRITKNIVGKYLWITMAAGIFFAVVSWYAFPLFTAIRPDFIPVVIPFRILLLSLPIFFVTSILQWSLIAKKKQKFLALIYIVSGIINTILNIIFIPAFGYVAAAIITGVTEGIVCIVFLISYFSSLKE